MLRALSQRQRSSAVGKLTIHQSVRRFSSIPLTGLLTRDFIGYSLYDRQVGYFNKPGIIHSPPELPFKEFLGGGAYKKHVAMLYQETPGAWLTPVELFKPHYAIAIAQWILRTRAATRTYAQAPLHIIEFGGGAGTCALNILDYLQWSHNELYQRTQYSIVELSSRLSREQQRRGARHGSHFRSINMSAADWNKRIDEPVFVIALEVLDNLPHDKVVVHPETGQVFETWVVPDSASASNPSTSSSTSSSSQSSVSSASSDSISIPNYSPSTGAGFREVLRPLGDPVIRRAWQYYQDTEKNRPTPVEKPSQFWSTIASFFEQKKKMRGGAGQVEPIYLPTVSLQVLEMLSKYLPRHYTFMADFNSLPDDDRIDGKLSPIVASKAGAVDTDFPSAVDTDFPTYLVPPGIADIFFPTDFDLLARAYTDICGRTCANMTQRDFLLQHARDVSSTETRNGDNPMLDDYANMSVLVTQPPSVTSSASSSTTAAAAAARIDKTSP